MDISGVEEMKDKEKRGGKVEIGKKYMLVNNWKEEENWIWSKKIDEKGIEKYKKREKLKWSKYWKKVLKFIEENEG